MEVQARQKLTDSGQENEGYWPGQSSGPELCTYKTMETSELHNILYIYKYWKLRIGIGMLLR